MGIWLSALNAIYRDLRFVVPFLVQIGFFVSPVVYETTALIPEKWRMLHSLNPMAGVIEGFRWAILGKGDPPITALSISVPVVFVLLVGGLFYFRRMEKMFVDRV